MTGPRPGHPFPDVRWQLGEHEAQKADGWRAAPRGTTLVGVTLGCSASRSCSLKASWCSFTQTVRPWHEGDKVWVSWTQTFNINVTKELLKKINFHKITLRVWDTKDKVSRKVRYYRLKNTGYGEDTGSFGKSGTCVLFETFLEACDCSPVTGSKPVSPPFLALTFPGHRWLWVPVVRHPSRTGLSIRKFRPRELSEAGQCPCTGVGHHPSLRHISALPVPRQHPRVCSPPARLLPEYWVFTDKKDTKKQEKT